MMRKIRKWFEKCVSLCDDAAMTLNTINDILFHQHVSFRLCPFSMRPFNSLLAFAIVVSWTNNWSPIAAKIVTAAHLSARPFDWWVVSAALAHDSRNYSKTINKNWINFRTNNANYALRKLTFDRSNPIVVVRHASMDRNKSHSICRTFESFAWYSWESWAPDFLHHLFWRVHASWSHSTANGWHQPHLHSAKNINSWCSPGKRRELAECIQNLCCFGRPQSKCQIDFPTHPLANSTANCRRETIVCFSTTQALSCPRLSVLDAIAKTHASHFVISEFAGEIETIDCSVSVLMARRKGAAAIWLWI